MPTAHNTAWPGDFAKTVLMPGDPLRAKFIAEAFLQDAKLVNNVRGIQGYTGSYQGHPVSVMASGMGAPSMGIYSRELFDQYGVETILRIGTTGSLQDHIHVGDLILAAGACTDTNFLAHWKVTGFAPIAAPKLASRAMALAEQMGYTYYAGNVLTSDRFYMDDMEQLRRWRRMGVLGTEMETAALYATAAWCGKQALSILTVSDGMFNDEDTTPAQRETQFTRMMELALALAVELEEG